MLDFETLLAICPDYLYWVDKDNVYGGCNNNYATLCNLTSRHDIVGLTNASLLPASAFNVVIDRNNYEVIHSGTPKTFYEHLLLHSGRKMSLCAHKAPICAGDGSVIGLLCLAFDVFNAYLVGQADLQHLIPDYHLFCKTMLSSLAVNIYWKNKSGVYLLSNQNQARVLGLDDPSSLVGKTDFDLPWRDDGELLDNDLHVMQSGCSKSYEEDVVVNGVRYHYLSFKAPVIDEYGEVVGVLGVSSDITRQKDLEQRLREANLAVELANNAKTQFMENIRHDFRTPLSSIIHVGELLQAELDQGKIKEYLNAVFISARELLIILDSIFDSIDLVSGKVPIVHEVFSLKESLLNVIGMYKVVALEKNLALKYYFDDNIPETLVGDAIRLYRIILELLANSLKFTHQGYVKLSAFLVSHATDHVVIKIVVEDSGIGIAAEHHQHVFKRFYRCVSSSSGLYKGSGLGLSMVQQFVEDLGGQIHLESESHGGAKFIIQVKFGLGLLLATLPKQVSSEMAAPLLIADEVKEPSSLSALVIEDYDLIYMVVQSLLLDLGCDADCAPNAVAAVECIAAKHYDFIIVDVGLPYMSGYEFVTILRQREKAVPHKIPTFVVGLTGYVGEQQYVQCLNAGFDMVLAKPLLHDMATELVDIIQRYIISKKNQLSYYQSH